MGEGQDASDKTLDEAFSKFLQGKSIHRLTSAKTLLSSTEPSVIAELAKWRKGAHYLHANALAQAYFVSTEEWSALRGKPVVVEKTTYSLQSIVAKQLMRLISDVEIINTGEVPKLKKQGMNQNMFKDLCSSVLNAVKYRAALHAQYVGVWDEVGSAEKLFKRLIISGEPGLREVFLRGVAMAGGKIERLNFAETGPSSDVGQVCTRLQKAKDVLRQQQEQRAAAQRAAAATAAEAPPRSGQGWRNGRHRTAKTPRMCAACCCLSASVFHRAISSLVSRPSLLRP